jgi:uncharacterized protein (DUF342 family)
MKAFLYVADSSGGEYPTVDDLRSALLGRGVITGINGDALAAMANRMPCNAYIEVAGGIPAVPGVSASIEILIDVSQKGRPRVLPGGKVDHRDISYVVNVRKGAQLVRRIPPIPGKDGQTVFGRPVKAPIPDDKPLAAGRGTAMSPTTPNVLIADINGAVVVFPDGRVEVVDDKVISGNIDYSTGNIRFSGNLTVNGTVRAGFEIDVEGNCRIGGNVEDAKITCLGDLEIIGGAVGQSKGELKSAGSLKVRHLANFSVMTGGDIHILEDAVHCTMSSEGNVQVKSVVGGTIAAWKNIEAESIGTEAEARTVVDLGGKYLLMQRKYALLKELADFTGNIGSVKQAMFELVRDEMSSAGVLPLGAIGRLEEFKKKHSAHVRRCSEVQVEMEALDAKLAKAPVPYVKASTVFPNTLIKFGALEKLIKEKLVQVRIIADGDRIIVGK